MCPPTRCPSCRATRYHRGTCESCDYDPAGHGQVTNPPTITKVLETASRQLPIHYMVDERPFLRIRITTFNKDVVAEAMRFLGYSGPSYHHEAQDPLDTELWGFDIVKDHAKVYLGA